MWPEPNRSRGGEAGGASGRLIFGLLIIALGVVFLADNLGLVEGREAMRTFWPLAFVAFGFGMALDRHSSGWRRAWGAIWIGVGCWIWAYQRHWISINVWDVVFPAVLLFAGGALVWRSLAGPHRAGRSSDPVAEDYVRNFAAMSGNQLRSASTEFRGGDLTAFMGGVTLDLTRARMAGEEAHVDVFAMWGGIEIRVPPDWIVVSKVAPILGGFDDKTQPSSEAAGGRLVVSGVVVMGGVEVKN